MIIDSIKQKLQSALQPELLLVVDESHKHAGHRGVEGRAGGETHFRITVVSQVFAGLSRVKRHQHIYRLLAEELKYSVHALALKTVTADEYQNDAL